MESTKWKGVYRDNGKLVYRGLKFEDFNKPKPSNKKDKKFMVLAKYKEDIKLVHFGAKGYSDYTKHKDPKRRDNYRARHEAILNKEGKPAYKDPLSPAYWAYNYLW
jgi:hypothetical protein